MRLSFSFSLPDGDWRIVSIGKILPIKARSGSAVEPATGRQAKEFGVAILFLRCGDSGRPWRERRTTRRFVGVGLLPAIKLGSTWRDVGDGASVVVTAGKDEPGETIDLTAMDVAGLEHIFTSDWIGIDDPSRVHGATPLDQPMSYWLIEDAEGPILLPVPVVLAEAFMPSGRFARWLLEKQGTGVYPLFLHAESGFDRETITIMATLRLTKAEARKAAALIVSASAWRCFSDLVREANGALPDGTNAATWLNPTWPFPSDARLSGSIRYRTLRRGNTEQRVRVLVSIKRLGWGIGERGIWVQYPGSAPAERVRGESRPTQGDKVVVHVGEAASPDGAKVSKHLPPPSFDEPSRVMFERLPGDREWGVVNPGAKTDVVDVTTGKPGPGGMLPRLEYGGVADAPPTALDDRLTVTLAALVELAEKNVIHPFQPDIGGPAVYMGPVPIIAGRARSWGLLEDRRRRILAARITFKKRIVLVVDCEVVGTKGIALSLVLLDGVSVGEPNWPSIIVRWTSERRGVLHDGDRIFGAVPTRVERVRHPSNDFKGGARPEIREPAISLLAAAIALGLDKLLG